MTNEEDEPPRPVQRLIDSISERAASVIDCYDKMLEDIAVFHDDMEQLGISHHISSKSSKPHKRRQNIADATVDDPEDGSDGADDHQFHLKSKVTWAAIQQALQSHFLFSSMDIEERETGE